MWINTEQPSRSTFDVGSGEGDRLGSNRISRSNFFNMFDKERAIRIEETRKKKWFLAQEMHE